MTSKISSKGQLTIPREVREHLGLRVGSKVRFKINEAGEVVLYPVLYTLDDLIGCLGEPPSGKSLSPEEIDEAIGEAIVERYLRAGHKRPDPASGEGEG